MKVLVLQLDVHFAVSSATKIGMNTLVRFYNTYCSTFSNIFHSNYWDSGGSEGRSVATVTAVFAVPSPWFLLSSVLIIC